MHFTNISNNNHEPTISIICKYMSIMKNVENPVLLKRQSYGMSVLKARLRGNRTGLIILVLLVCGFSYDDNYVGVSVYNESIAK